MAVTARSAVRLQLLAPLAGWVLPLAEVPDPVFAGAMAGDGVAIDPIGESLHAPCDGTIALLGAYRHALTIGADGVEVLMHVGIDTMKLEGEGFRLRVRDGERVRAGQLLLEFDLDAIVRRAPSAITPVLLGGRDPGRIVDRQSHRRVAVGDLLYAVEPAGAVPGVARPPSDSMVRGVVRQYRVPFEHGLHARPAAQVAAALANLGAEVSLRARGREANARSVVSMMALGVMHGERLTAQASGPQAAAALAALDVLLVPVVEAPLVQGPSPGTEPPAPGTRLAGLVAVSGLASGIAAPLAATEPPIGPALGDQAAERARLAAAIDDVAVYIGHLREPGVGLRHGLLDAHLALLADPQLRRDADAALAGGASAGLAWRGALRAAAGTLLAVEDPRMAERSADLLDIEHQVLQVLSGGRPGTQIPLPERAIVLADELLPSQLLALESSRPVGLCMAQGGATSHVAILAASMGLPTLVAAGASVLAIAAGTPLVLDADAGVLLVDPEVPERRRLDALIAARREQRVCDEAAAQQPATLRDGTRIHVFCNLGAVADAAPAVSAGAEGCGLLRTEFLFLARSQAPDESEQLAQYQAIAEALAGRPVAIRTLDAGGDKPISYLAMPREANPALGLRGLRTSLARPELLTAQLRAICRVTPAGQCRVLLPMVTDLGDVRAVRAQLASACEALGVPVPPVGAMIETPAAALLADQLATECDFLSIGSNDLAQYTLAMDRLHPTLAERLDAMHPAVLRLIERTTRAGTARRIEIGVCGNLAADADAVPLLIGFGIRELSVASSQLPRLKALVRTLAIGACADLARRALELANASEVRALVRAWRAQHA
jgi:multiphosphoryl transfer protein